jgi:hypothetical protein
MDARVAVGRRQTQAAFDDSAQVLRKIGREGRRLVAIAQRNRAGNLAFEGQLAAEAFVQDHAQRVDVGALVPARHQHLRRHVVGRAARERQRHASLAEQARKTVVAHARLIALEEDVAGLEIEMRQPQIVQRRHAARRLGEVAQRFLARKPARAQRLGQRAVARIAHHQIGHTHHAAQILDRHQIRMVDRGEVAHLFEFAFDRRARRVVADLEELDREGLADRVLARLVDLAEGPAAQPVEDFVTGHEVRLSKAGVEGFPVHGVAAT